MDHLAHGTAAVEGERPSSSPVREFHRDHARSPFADDETAKSRGSLHAKNASLRRNHHVRTS